MAQMSKRGEAVSVHIVGEVDVEVEAAVREVAHLLAALDHAHDCPERLGLQGHRLDGPVEASQDGRALPPDHNCRGAEHSLGAHQPREVLAGEVHGATVLRTHLQNVNHGVGNAEVGQPVPVQLRLEHQRLGHLLRLLCNLGLVAVLVHQLHRQLREALLVADVLIHPAARAESVERLSHGSVAPRAILTVEMVLDVLDDRLDAPELPRNETVLVYVVKVCPNGTAQGHDRGVVHVLHVDMKCVVQCPKLPCSQAVVAIEQYDT
mmetsp:Transcript_89584/g.278789  ORF Transcript_89584/g.278789 Transcript_89584/m.278789 type:complete len:264 (+) Transcript_89584:244-1035(+)